MTTETKASPGRPREFDEGEALTAMMNVFWRKGYEGTSLSDLVEATGLLRGSLYAAFGSKAEMYTHALNHYHAEIVVVGVNALDADDDPEIALRNFMCAPLDDRLRQGCFLCNASADRADSDPDTATRVRHSFARLEDALAGLVSRIKPDWNNAQVRGQASLLLTTYTGLRIMSRSGVNQDTMHRAIETVLDI